jgi:hypothetical protein
MAALGARVIDLEEFRRRRAARDEVQIAAARPNPAYSSLASLCVWYPVWYWVPLVTGV